MTDREMTALVLISASLLAGCSQGSAEVETQNSGARLGAVENMEMPPEQFRRDRITLATVATMNLAKVREVCASEDALACAGREASFDVLYIPNPCSYSGESYARMLCHEMAHLQGWSHDTEPGADPDATRCQGIMIMDSSCRDFALRQKDTPKDAQP